MTVGEAAVISDPDGVVLGHALATGRMRDRIPAQAVIEKLVAAQDAARRPPLIARLFGAPAIRPANLPWYTSATGERALADQLRRLPADWQVFHSVPVGLGSGDIDHVVAGPAGIFTISTRHHPGGAVWVAGNRVLVNGTPQPKYIAAANAEARCLERTLSGRMLTDPPVRAVVAFVGARRVTVREAPDDVTVLEGQALVRWLTGQPVTIESTSREHLVRVIDDPSTWRISRDVDRAELERRFILLSVLNRQAKLTQTMWGLIGLVVGVAVASGLATMAVNWMF